MFFIYIFESGKEIKSYFGDDIIIDSYIGTSSYADNYIVTYHNNKKILKWINTSTLNQPFNVLNNLEKNIKMGTPNNAFLWPETIVTSETDASFGYIVDIIPDDYYELADVLIGKNKTYESYKTIIDTCINIVFAFRSIYNIGYCFHDLDLRSFFINPQNGGVLIDYDLYLSPNGSITNYCWSPQYSAPEIVMEKKSPDVHSNEFSLAVILFMILCKGHPLEGEHWCVSCLTPEKEEKLYGSHATFIFDPDDTSNRPVKGVHDYVINMWEALPQYVKEAFISAFSQDAIKNPNRRVTYLEWLKIFVRFQSDIVRCHSCGGEIFIQNLTDTECDDCGTIYEVKNTFKLYEYSVTASKNTRIYRCQVGLCNADHALDPIGLVVYKKNNPNILGFKNMTNNNLKEISSGGETNTVYPGGIIPLISGTKVIAFDSIIEIF